MVLFDFQWFLAVLNGFLCFFFFWFLIVVGGSWQFLVVLGGILGS